MMFFLSIAALISVCFLGTSHMTIPGDNTVKHIVEIYHPGIDLTNAVKKTLIQIKGKNDKADQFYMDVETVVCGDSQCKIDVVRIFWNEMGFFDRLELPSNVFLEKAEGKLFTPEDYKKLNTILINRACSLKDVYIDEIVNTSQSDGLDAMTGATVLVNINDFVKGAVWTCYSLWHWANGNVNSIIRDIRGDDYEMDNLIDLYVEDDDIKKVFALEQLIRKKTFEKYVCDTIVKFAQYNNYELTGLTIDYMLKLSPDNYFSSLEKLIKNVPQTQLMRYLRSMKDYSVKPTVNFAENICSSLLKRNSYEVINEYFNILTKAGIRSEEIVEQVVSLLENEDFLIARRSYYFLQHQTLTRLQNETLMQFTLKYSEKL